MAIWPAAKADTQSPLPLSAIWYILYWQYRAGMPIQGYSDTSERIGYHKFAWRQKDYRTQQCRSILRHWFRGEIHWRVVALWLTLLCGTKTKSGPDPVKSHGRVIRILWQKLSCFFPSIEQLFFHLWCRRFPLYSSYQWAWDNCSLCQYVLLCRIDAPKRKITTTINRAFRERIICSFA